MTDTLKENAWGIGLTLIGTGIGVLLSKAAGAVIIIAGLALIIWKETHKPRSRPEQQRGLPEHRPRVKPVAYGGEGDACGLTIANPGYDASDVHIPPVPVAGSAYTLTFPERVALLTERDHHRLIVARLEHAPQPDLNGEKLLALMRSANVESLKFAIIYRDDSGEHRSNCAIERDGNVLAVRCLNQEFIG